MCVYVCANHERNDIEKRYPRMLRQELLSKCQGQWRCDPANLHDRHEACLDGSSDLMISSRACNESHRDKIDCVLDWRYLFSDQKLARNYTVETAPRWILTIRLLTKICIIFALRLVLPANTFWRSVIKT